MHEYQYLPVATETRSFLLNNKTDINFSHVKICVNAISKALPYWLKQLFSLDLMLS